MKVKRAVYSASMSAKKFGSTMTAAAFRFVLKVSFACDSSHSMAEAELAGLKRLKFEGVLSSDDEGDEEDDDG